MKIKTTLAILALGATVLGVGCSANSNCCRPPPPAGQAGGPRGPGMKGHRPPPPSPLMQALDVNHDGIIDSNEIVNASAELKTLDKNGDGQLTPDELRPARPPQNGGPESGNDKPVGPPPGNP
ncbi:MAG: EF-hand domain-containing protein [Verrucomicrobiota bacterium]